MKLTHKYLKKLGFPSSTEETDLGELFLYHITINKQTNDKISLPFIFYEDEKSLFNYHLNEWNRNEISFFIAIGDKQSHIINAKEKAKNENLLKSNLIIIDSFDYGTNTIDYENITSLPFTKENFDNSFFFDFVLQKQKAAKNEIDTYLLNSLIALRDEFTKFDKNNENINGLILKSLFVKYLDDRNILPNINFTEVLKKGNPKKLKKVFSDIAVINGDILKKDLIITANHIKELEIFYTHDYREYKKGQLNLFYPYKFDKIPIKLISNIYEEFLGRTNKQKKKSKGIFYTRTFVIDFMLSHNIYPKIEKQPKSTVLDPACGSGAFLVRAYNKILNSQKNKKLSIDEKSNILKKQIFGIDIDENALQITAFSLYLTLLQGISKEEIQKQIEIQKSILPSLIGSNLLKKNTITDDIQFNIEINKNKTTSKYSFTKFDCIVANPPWTISKDKEIKNIHSKKEIYSPIHKRYLQLSQFFLLKIFDLSNEGAEISVIVNSSNFFSEFSIDFRKALLKKFHIKYFYELSKIKDILFNNSGKRGALEPASVLILNIRRSKNDTINYISPKLSKLNKKLRIITYSSKDIKIIKQEDIAQEDILWRIFVNGNWQDYQLIKKQIIQKDNNIKIECEQGIQGQLKPSYIFNKQANALLEKEFSRNNITENPDLSLIGKFYHNYTDLKNSINKKIKKYGLKLKREAILNIIKVCDEQTVEVEPKRMRKYFDKDDFDRYSFGLSINFMKSINKEINWNNNIKRKRNENLYKGERILVLRQPNKNDGLKLKALYTNQDFVFADKIIGLKIDPVKDYRLYFAILNSSIAGYYLVNISSQWHKGRRNTLLNSDLINFPFPKLDFSKPIIKNIKKYVELIEDYKKHKTDIKDVEKQLDELIFDLYGLLEFEKEIIREFYKVNVERKDDFVKEIDIKAYIEKFREVYQLMIKKDLRLNASYITSQNIGSVVKFDIVKKKNYNKEIIRGNFSQQRILQLVKKHQVQHELLNGYINEEKVRIYEEKSFYIIKSNLFKDWTKRQALVDANEEVKEILKKLF